VGNFTHLSTFSSLVRDERRLGKCKVYFRTGHEGSGRKYGCSSTLSVTTALVGGGQIGDLYLQNPQSRFSGFSEVDAIERCVFYAWRHHQRFFEHFIKP
jgi:hypothetical protein